VRGAGGDVAAPVRKETNAQAHPPIAVSQRFRFGCVRDISPFLYRQRCGENRDGVVRPGFRREEDVAFKTNGNTIDYTLMPFAPHRQKIVSALTSGVVPVE
jgi:hypothetical protein